MTSRYVNGIKILHYETLDSTNRLAMQLQNAEHLLTVFADCQTGGRGRLGRSFYSYNGGLYMSVVLRLDHITIPLELLTPAAALAVRSALTRHGADGLSVKWVNDILCGGKKVCGILTELGMSDDGTLDRAVVGIGINLASHDAFPEELLERAGCLSLDIDTPSLAAEITKIFEAYLQKGKDLIIKEYSDSLAFVGETVEVTDYTNTGEKLRGTLLGVTEYGHLKLRLPDGSVRQLRSGEITDALV